MAKYNSGKAKGMSLLEIDALFKFVTKYSGSTDLRKIAEILSVGQKDDFDVMTVLLEAKKRKTLKTLHDFAVLVELSLSDVVETLYNQSYHQVAEKLYSCHLKCKKSRSIFRMNKIQLENRKKISAYFKNIKKLVHEIAFKDPYADVQRLGKIMKQNIRSESDSVRKMYLCDKYTVLKAAEMDALVNITGTVSPDHEGYSEMESFIASTSNPSLSQVILFARKADVLSTVGCFENGEELLQTAYMCADCIGPCVEITDMIYKNVVFKLSQLERGPTIDLQKSLLLEASRGIWSLNEEAEDMRIFWKRLFLLRIVFCLLGIGKFCDMINNYIPTKQSIKEAGRILASDVLINMEHRRMMFYYTAKARLCEWECDLYEALVHVRKAAFLAKEGNYYEYKALKMYEIKLLKSVAQNSHIQEYSTADPVSIYRPVIYLDDSDVPDVEISFNSISISDESSTFHSSSNTDGICCSVEPPCNTTDSTSSDTEPPCNTTDSTSSDTEPPCNTTDSTSSDTEPSCNTTDSTSSNT